MVSFPLLRPLFLQSQQSREQVFFYANDLFAMCAVEKEKEKYKKKKKEKERPCEWILQTKSLK